MYQHRRNYIGTGITNRQANRIQYFVYASADGTDTKLNYRYSYDSAGNIKEVYRSVGSDTLAFYQSFEYDKLGQLTEATDSRGTETYTYNTAGNMLNRTLGGDTVQYSYENSQWNDLLTAYDGQKIAYEGQTYNSSSNSVTGTVVSGNPVSYYNGTRWDMAWTNGWRLAEASSDDTDISYTYDSSGLRTSKTVNGTTYQYAYMDGKLIWQEWNGNELFFFYDEADDPIGFWYHPATGSNVTGYYMTTQQGDITRIEDVNGNVLATYEYDAWGKLISSSGSLAEINPLRYRGYYYDTETGFYYLQSRYYDPSISRFINADGQINNDLLGYNLFAYCGNNPVNRTDDGGQGWWVLVGGVIGGIVGGVSKIVSNVTSGEKWNKGVVGAVVGGIVSGAITAATGNLVAGAFAGAAVESALNEVTSYVPRAAQMNGYQTVKRVTPRNIARSVATVASETAVNGTVSLVTGKIAENIIPMNSGWFKPKKLVSCLTGRYAQKAHLQTLAQTGLSLSYEGFKSAVDYNTEQEPIVTFFPNTVISAAR